MRDGKAWHEATDEVFTTVYTAAAWRVATLMRDGKAWHEATNEVYHGLHSGGMEGSDPHARR